MHGDAGAARSQGPSSLGDWGEIQARVERLLEAPIANVGCRLLDVIYRHEGRWVLRLVIDKQLNSSAAPAGTPDAVAAVDGAPVDTALTLDDCGAVSELAGRILDVEDPIPHRFSLEVTSPGMFRLLKERKHFAQSVGKVVRFTLAPGVFPERKERTVRGTLVAMTDDGVRVLLGKDVIGEETLTVPLESIRSARLDPDL